MPVLFACQGCPEFGDAAAGFALAQQAGGEAEAALLGPRGGDETQLASKARSRYPIHAVDGCIRGCARAWLRHRGVEPQRCVVL